MRFNYNVPLGVPNLGTPFKCNPLLAALGGAAVSGLFSLAGNAQQAGYTKEQQKLQSRLNREEMAHSMALQRGYQEWMNNTQYGASVSGMKNAGLNPAMAGGSGSGVGASGSVGKPSSGSSGPAFHGEGLGSAVAQGAGTAAEIAATQKRLDNETKVAEAQAAALNAQAEKDSKSGQLMQLDINSYEDRLAADLALKGQQTEEAKFHAGLYKQQKESEEQNTKNLQATYDNIKKQGKVLDATVTELNARARQEDAQALYLDMKRVWEKREIQALISHYKTEDQTMIFNAVVGLYSAQSQAELNAAVARWQNAQAQLAEDYGDMDHIVRNGTQILTSIGGMIFGAKFAKKFPAMMSAISKLDKKLDRFGRMKKK